MKKLMMALAVVACAATVQASTVKWNVNSIYGVDAKGVGQTASSSRPTAGQYYVLCMLASEMSLSDAQKALSKGNVADIAAKATFQGTTTGTGQFQSNFYDGKWAADAKAELYAVILNANTIEGATYGVMSASVTSYTFADSAEDKMLSLNMKTATQGSWTALSGSVPEPTSGLLVLVGLAGLALKRKRA